MIVWTYFIDILKESHSLMPSHNFEQSESPGMFEYDHPASTIFTPETGVGVDRSYHVKFSYYYLALLFCGYFVNHTFPIA